MTFEAIFKDAIRNERRPDRVVAASYGTDAVKMIQEGKFFKPELVGLYARIAAHFGRAALKRES